jgi:hypothetical protein
MAGERGAGEKMIGVGPVHSLESGTLVDEGHRLEKRSFVCQARTSL